MAKFFMVIGGTPLAGDESWIESINHTRNNVTELGMGFELLSYGSTATYNLSLRIPINNDITRNIVIFREAIINSQRVFNTIKNQLDNAAIGQNNGVDPAGILGQVIDNTVLYSQVLTMFFSTHYTIFAALPTSFSSARQVRADGGTLEQWQLTLTEIQLNKASSKAGNPAEAENLKNTLIDSTYNTTGRTG